MHHQLFVRTNRAPIQRGQILPQRPESESESEPEPDGERFTKHKKETHASGGRLLPVLYTIACDGPKVIMLP